MLILDTSAAIEILKSTQKGVEVRKYLEGQEVSITAFTVHELMMGVRQSEIPKTQAFLTSIKIFDFDTVSAIESAKIEKQLISKGKKIEESDIFIAGICLSNNSKLITLDKDFLQIKELDVRIF